MIYTARYANARLKTGNYTAVRISVGTPKWPLGYNLDAEINELMPFGLFQKYEDYESFEPAYFKRLDSYGVAKIKKKLDDLEARGKDVVLLCYEDIRKGPSDWCHRIAFSKWYKLRTGIEIPELEEASPYVPPKPKAKPKTEEEIEQESPWEQTSLFSW